MVQTVHTCYVQSAARLCYIITQLSAYGLCAAGVPVEQCQAYEVCVPLNAAQLRESQSRLPAGAALGNVGICTAPLPKGLLLPNTSTVDPPM